MTNQEAAYHLSKDYGRLFDLLCAGHIAVGWVDYKTGHGDELPCRDVVQVIRHGEFDVFVGARGISYGGLYSFHRSEGDERDVFIKMCGNVNLEWLEPAEDYRAAVRAALLALRAEIRGEKFTNDDWTINNRTHNEAINLALEYLDATIAKLGLSAAEDD